MMLNWVSCLTLSPQVCHSSQTLLVFFITKTYQEVRGEDRGEKNSQVAERVIIRVFIKLGQKGDCMIISKDLRKLASVFIFNFLWFRARILLMHSEAQNVIKQEHEDSSSAALSAA